MTKVGIVLYPFQFLGDDLFGFGLYPVVIFLNHFLHPIYAILVDKAEDNGNFAVRLFLGAYPVAIDHDLTMENLLVYPLGEIVGHRTDKQPLGQIRNFRRWY